MKFKTFLKFSKIQYQKFFNGHFRYLVGAFNKLDSVNYSVNYTETHNC